MPKQTEIEQGFTLLARSDQWERFVGLAVDVSMIDWLISEGSIKHATNLLQTVTNNNLVPKLAAHVTCAREAYLNQCNTEVIDPNKEVI